MKKGFTLIELLVVVLIIGILAAVALPQYTKAVEKSRFAQVEVMTKALHDSIERYYMANAEMPKSFDDLDITLSGTKKNNGQKISWNGYVCSYFNDIEGASNSVLCQTNKGLGIRHFYSAGYDRKNRYCITFENHKEGNELCKSMGGQNPFNSGAGLVHYLLP